MIIYLLDVTPRLCSGWVDVLSEEFSTGEGSGVAGRPSALCDKSGDFSGLGLFTIDS